ncbi:MAG TPA: hypothetical protein ENI23_00255 [bacterium]|nr:hypothetical protein [bacterium]
MAQFETPERFAGKTLSQIRNEAGAAFRPDVLEKFIGLAPNTVLKAGQSFSGDFDPGSGEFQFLSSQFDPGGTAQTAFGARQKEEEQGFLTALKGKIAGQEKLGVAAERIGGKLDLPGLRQSAFDLTTTLKGIPEAVLTASKEFGLSAPQIQGRIASEQARIAPRAQEATAQAQFGEAELGRRLGLLIAEQSKELRPDFEAQLPLLQDRLAREQSNYQQDKQNELTLLLTNMSQGFQASQADLDRVNILAREESAYEQSLEKIKFSTDESLREAKGLQELKGTGAGASDIGKYFQPQQTQGIQSLWISPYLNQ